MTTVQTLKFETPDQGEETARADLYGLLAALFHAPPSRALLDSIAGAPAHGDGVLEVAWRELALVCKSTSQEAAREEYEALFLGIGKPEVILYGSYYLAGFMMEKPLVELRTELAALGLERSASVVESEDHIASLCEVMRYLIASDDAVNTTVARQKLFFGNHMQAWILDMCGALATHPKAKFYLPVAHLAQCFFEVEMQAFDMA